MKIQPSFRGRGKEKKKERISLPFCDTSLFPVAREGRRGKGTPQPNQPLPLIPFPSLWRREGEGRKISRSSTTRGGGGKEKK